MPLEIPEDSPGAITFTHEGSQNFAVWSVDAQGNQMGLLVNTIGSYQGTRPIDFQTGQAVAELEIEASDPGTLEAKPLPLTAELNALGPFSGNGDDVVLVPSGLQGSAVTLSHQGDQNFAIWAYGDAADLLVNDIGSRESRTAGSGDASRLCEQGLARWARTVSNRRPPPCKYARPARKRGDRGL